MEIIYVQSITVLQCAVDEDAGVSLEAFASRHRQSVRREPKERIEFFKIPLNVLVQLAN